MNHLQMNERILRALAAALLCITVLLAASGPGVLAAGESGPSDSNEIKKIWPTEGAKGELFHEVAGQLRCPTCTGLSVLDSDARFSQQIKEIVLEQVEGGKSQAEILKYFTERYGVWILRSPPTTGFNIVAWALPIAILLLGPPAVWFFVWRRRRVVSTMGVRPASDILREMDTRLAELRR